MSEWRLGVDIRSLVPPRTGIGVMTRALLEGLVSRSECQEIFCYATKAGAFAALPDGPFEHRLGRGLWAQWGSLWMQTTVARVAEADALDLFWGPLQVLPLPLCGVVPTVVSLHDLVFLKYAETMSWRNRLLLRRLAVPSLERADRVVAVSQATAQMAQEHLDIDADKIRVVHHGVGKEFSPGCVETSRQRLAALLRFEGDYMLFVGTLEPRKNLLGLLAAFEQLGGDFGGHLVCAGGGGWRSREWRRRLDCHPYRHRIHLLGFVGQDWLPHLYRAARVFVMPSWYEGFGLPVIEAMAAGTPVVCSDREPFPEITSGAARLAPPGDPAGLASAIESVWSDEAGRRQMRQAGLHRARDFDWQKSVEGLVAVFRELVA